MTEGACAVSAIVVTYRRHDVLVECLSSVLASLAVSCEPSELIVVDNSGGVVGATVRERFPDVRLVELPHNHGFAGGVNAGLRRCRGDFALLVNDDAVLERGAVAELLRVIRSADDVGSVAAQMRFARDRDTLVAPRINSAGIEMDRLGVAYDRLLGEPAGASEDLPVEVFGACGGAALYRRAMLTDVGGFDETFFVYLEDLDVAWRARLRGWRAMYAPAAIVAHHHSLTSRHGSPEKYFNVGRNRIRVLAKNADTRLLLRYGLLMVGYDLVYCVFAGLRDRTAAPVRGRIAGLREWRIYRARVDYRRALELPPPRGVREALRRYNVWTKNSLGLGR